MNSLIQTSSVTSGTVTALDTQQDCILIHDAGVTDALTITFPSTPCAGQIFSITSSGGITTLTLTAAHTIIAALTTLAVGGGGSWAFNGTKWYKIT